MKKAVTNTDDFDYKTIKTIKDACKKTGYDMSKFPKEDLLKTKFGRPLIAANNLMIVHEAVNNGWKPDWSDTNQYKYFPWHWIKKDANHPTGFGFSSSYFGDSLTRTGLGSLLCCESSEKAIYIAKQFKKDWKDLLLGLY